MYNTILDGLPTEYKGYRLNTDFRIALEIDRILSSATEDEVEKKVTVLQMLYMDEVPEDYTLAWEGLTWFLTCGDTKNINTLDVTEDDTEDLDIDIAGDSEEKDRYKNKGGAETVIDYDFDSTRIFTAFLRTYNVNLRDIEYLHYFDFVYMLSDVDEECFLSKVIEYRTTSLKGKKGEERRALRKVKKLYEIPYEIDEQSKKDLEEFGFDDSDFDLYMQ